METPVKFGVVLGVTTIRMLLALGGSVAPNSCVSLHPLLVAPSLTLGALGCSKLEISACSHDSPELDGEAMLLLEVPLLLAKASGAFTKFWELALAPGVSPGLSQGLMSAPITATWFRSEIL